MTLHRVPELSDFDAGFFVGLMVGEGSFTGDSKQACIALKMTINHRNTFDWIQDRLPGGELYGPHGPYRSDGIQRASTYTWLARRSYLTNVIVPLLDFRLGEEHSERAYFRYLGMKRKYGL